MRPITVVPSDAVGRITPLLEAAGWHAAPAGDAPGVDLGTAADIVAGGAPVIYAAAAATPADLRRILVLHEGTRGDRAGMDAADEAAVASGAEIVVLHVPPSAAGASTASLPFRVADHGTYDWAEWRDEFMRRFCRCSPGVRVALRIGGASGADLQREIAETSPDLVIASGPTKDEAGVEPLVESLFNGALPVLVVPAVGQEHTTRRPQASGPVEPAG